MSSTAAVRSLEETALVRMVPLQSGLQYIDCPNCTAGRQERQLEWSMERPDVVTCAFCQHEYPSPRYPMRDVLTVQNPRGEQVQFEYWADETGYRHFFKARRDDEIRRYLARQTLNLARLYSISGERSHARRAALLLDRFAQVFPAWCYHFDYPFRQKEIFSGNIAPDQFLPNFRTARWNWWAYSDIPTELVDAYTLLRGSGEFERLSQDQGVDVEARIVHDLLRNAGDQVLANREDFGNMSPTAWSDLVRLGRAIHEPTYVHEVVRRFRKFLDLTFLYDGFWHEGAPSYGWQTVNGLANVLRELRGYSDPAGYLDPVDGVRFDNLDLEAEFPLLGLARVGLQKMRLPNGRLVPVHDTWATAERMRPPSSWQPYLIPALGHASLGGGQAADRAEWHLTWSGGYGHQHADILSLMLFAQERELLSDLGYTHTAYRAWTLATAAHNTVVIDGLSQARGSTQAPTDGNLQFINIRHPRVQTVSVDGRRSYPGLATQYRRTVVVINSGMTLPYAVDVFEVAGGHTHDYFLHGDADGPTQVVADLELNELATLLPQGFDWRPTTNEGQAGRAYEPHYAYGFLNELRSHTINGPVPIQIRLENQPSPAPGLKVTLLPEVVGQLVLGRNPSIRQADEDDTLLEKFHRPFLMWRQQTEQGRSTFVSVLEPFARTPSESIVKRLPSSDGSVVLAVELGNHTELVCIGAETEQVISLPGQFDGQARFQGQVGVLTIQSGKVQSAYALGSGGWRMGDFVLAGTKVQQAVLADAEPEAFIVQGTHLTHPEVGSVIRVQMADGWVYPYHVQNVSEMKSPEALRLQLVEGPGFEFDAARQHVRFQSFPQREHRGPVHVEWQAASTWQADNN